MDDYGEIVSAIARIMWAVDHQDRALFADGWSEDVDFEVTFFGQPPLRVRGREALVARFTVGWNGASAALRHQVGAVAVEPLAEGRARASFCCAYFTVGEATAYAGLGEYEDELAKGSDGRWRVTRRRHRFLTPLAH